MYDNTDEASSRLSNTIIMVGKQPAKVDAVYYSDDGPDKENILLDIKYLPTLRRHKKGADGPNGEVRLYREDVNYKKYNIGYINGKRSCVYAARLPTRRYKQGLNQENLKFSAPIDILISEDEEWDGSIPAFSNLIRYTAFSQMLQNNYPCFKQALNKIESFDNVAQVAYHKDNCISKHSSGVLMVAHKKNTVGYIHPDNGKLFLNDRYRYLDKYMCKTGAKVNDA